MHMTLLPSVQLQFESTFIQYKRTSKLCSFEKAFCLYPKTDNYRASNYLLFYNIIQNDFYLCTSVHPVFSQIREHFHGLICQILVHQNLTSLQKETY